MDIDSKLLEILACPACEDRPNVTLENDGIHCPKCGRIYPVADGIPIMLVEKAVSPCSGGKEHTQ